MHLKNVHLNETTGRTVDDVVLCHLLLIFYVSNLAELTVIDLVYRISVNSCCDNYSLLEA